jgi:basic membrane protein A
MQAVDYSRNIGYFTGREYDLLVTTGSVLGRATEAAALDAPTTSFIGVDQHYKETHSNLATITIPYDQVGFLAGWLASYMSGTGTVAAVCETSELDSMRLICEGFHAGANSAQADIRALVRYRADRPDELLFSDHEWAASMTEGLIALGADVIFAAGGGTAEAALVAASKAQVYAIGAERDQWYFLREARPRLITSVYAAPSAVIGGLAGRVAAGGTVGTGAMAAITVGPLHDPEGQISPAMMNELQTLIMRFNAGELQSGVSPLRAD